MADIQVFSSSVALLGDIVGSRKSDRSAAHRHILAAISATNAAVEQLDPLRVTVGDELQGVYASLGDALSASFMLRNLLFDAVDLRFGLGGGEVRVLDAERGIQDGTAWALAREAIEAVEALAREPGQRGLRTAVRDERPAANPIVEQTAQLVDAHLAALGPGPRASFTALYDGLDNRTAAGRLGISPSANSQRVNNNQLRPLLAAIRALTTLP